MARWSGDCWYSIGSWLYWADVQAVLIGIKEGCLKPVRSSGVFPASKDGKTHMVQLLKSKLSITVCV